MSISLYKEYVIYIQTAICLYNYDGFYFRDDLFIMNVIYNEADPKTKDTFK